MMRNWRLTLLLAVVTIIVLSGSYWAFYEVVSGGQKKVAQHKTPEEVWSEELRRMERLGRKPSPEEEEIIRMCLWMSYLTDKVVTGWLYELDNRWYPPLAPYEPIWPRCDGGIDWILDLNPPPRREGIGLRKYVILNGVKCELLSGHERTSGQRAPWSGVWGLVWRNDAAKKCFIIRTEWFHYPDALENVQGFEKIWKWPIDEVASYAQIHGDYIAAIINYAIKHGSFSGPIIGDDSFFIIGIWFKTPKGWEYSEFKDTWLRFKKYNFRVTIEVKSMGRKAEPATDGERNMAEKIARLVEAQIIAYSLFGLDKFTVLKVALEGQELYLPVGRINSGNYLMPVRYVLEQVTGKRPFYNATEQKMELELGEKQMKVQGELIEATNRRFKIPDEERFVTRWENLRDLLDLRMVQDIRFEQQVNLR